MRHLLGLKPFRPGRPFPFALNQIVGAWPQMRWLSGKCCCRDCYKIDYENATEKPYEWDDLNGERPREG